MSNKIKSSVESTQDSATATHPTPVIQGAFANIPVTQSSKSGTGQFYTVWPKKDLQGTPSRMEQKEGDKIVNKGDIMKDPETGLDIELIRVHRGKRVWYGKQLVQAQPVEVESAE